MDKYVKLNIYNENATFTFERFNKVMRDVYDVCTRRCLHLRHDAESKRDAGGWWMWKKSCKASGSPAQNLHENANQQQRRQGEARCNKKSPRPPT